MRKFDQQRFNEFIVENNVITFQPTKLRSGRISPYYINWRNVLEDVYLIDELTDYVIVFVEDLGLNPDCFYGCQRVQQNWESSHSINGLKGR